MIKTIKQAFEQSIPRADWMDDRTKEKALEKVRTDDGRLHPFLRISRKQKV